MTWREEAKSLGIPMYRRTKIDVLKDIEAKKNEPTGKTRVVITRKEAVNVCCKALKEYAVEQGLDPDEEILISRWYLQMNRNNMTFIGRKKDMTKMNKDESPAASEIAPEVTTETAPVEPTDSAPEATETVPETTEPTDEVTE